METISSYLITFLLNGLWQIALIAAVAALVCRLMRNGPAEHRHAVWVAALAASLLLPMASIRRGEDSAGLRSVVPPAAALTGSSEAGIPKAPGVASTPTRRTISYAPAIGSILLAAYALFLLVRCGKLLRRWLETERIRNQAATASRIPPRVEKVWLRCLAAFELSDVELLSSPALPSPVTAGARRKTIILPEALLAETSEDVLVTAIGHEMAHLARHDFALRLLYEVIWLPIAFHPAALVIRRGLEQTREMACDELVTLKLLDAGVYARSIVTIAAVMSGLPRPGYTLGVFDGDILEQRIRRLLERPAQNLKRARLQLATGMGALAVCVALAGGAAISARAQNGPAQDKIQTGVALIHNGDIAGAVQVFEDAVRLEPANIRPKLFLANALLREQNTDRLAEARQQYLDTLSLDPKNRQAMEGLVSVAIVTRQFSEAHDLLMKVIGQDPQDESAYYTMGFLDWSVVYPPYAQARAAAGMRPQDPGIIPDAAVRQNFRTQYAPQLEEGFRMLQIALQLNPADDNAMAYLNLLYRIESAIADTDAESRELVGKADAWVGKALETKRQNAQNPKAAAAGLDASGEAPGPFTGQAKLGPPPPPPPPPQPGFVGDLSQPPTATQPTTPHNAGEGTFWQVVGSAGEQAQSVASGLKRQGFPVQIATGSDGRVRLLVGPYADAQSLAQAKAALTAAGVVVLGAW